MIGDETKIYGSYRRYEASHYLYFGDVEAYPNEWTDDYLRVTLPVLEPGEHAIWLVEGRWYPDIEDRPPSIYLGKVTVIPCLIHDDEPIEAGKIAVRLAPSVSPADVAIGEDRFARMFPDAEARELLARWYSVDVPPGLEEERVWDYCSQPSVEFAQTESAAVVYPAEL